MGNTQNRSSQTKNPALSLGLACHHESCRLQERLGRRVHLDANEASSGKEVCVRGHVVEVPEQQPTARLQHAEHLLQHPPPLTPRMLWVLELYALGWRGRGRGEREEGGRVRVEGRTEVRGCLFQHGVRKMELKALKKTGGRAFPDHSDPTRPPLA